MGYRGLFPDEYLDDPEFARSRVERWRMWTWQEFAGSEMLSAVVDERVVGFAHVGPERTPDGDVTVDFAARGPRFEQPVGEVYGFYLHPDAWGSGVATTLMRRATDRLQAQGHRRGRAVGAARQPAGTRVLREGRMAVERSGHHVAGAADGLAAARTGARGAVLDGARRAAGNARRSSETGGRPMTHSWISFDAPATKVTGHADGAAPELDVVPRDQHDRHHRRRRDPR